MLNGKMPSDSFERMSMLDSSFSDSARDLYLKLRRRLDRYAIIVSIVIVILLLGSIISLSGFSSRLVRVESHLDDPSLQQIPLTIAEHIANRTLGFEEIFVINLPERTDHRDGMVLAAAVSDMDVTFVDGVRASTIPDKARPPGSNSGVKEGQIGAWRAHLNAIQQVVKRGLSSALIMEDDVDWDVRFRDILTDYAVSANALTKAAPDSTISFDSLSKNSGTVAAPYSLDWDVLWLGHCGTDLESGKSRVIHPNDVTVPEVSYLRSWDLSAPSPMGIYPNHTRVAMTLSGGVCSLAYAVSQKGARGILNSLGLEKLDNPFDLMLRDFCTGDAGREPHTCFGVLPQIFDHYRAKGSSLGDSDIEEHKDGIREKAYTPNIRWSVRMNMARILRGETNYEDQYPDTS